MPSKRIIAPALLVVLFATLLVQLPLAIAERASVYEWWAGIQDIRFILSESYVSEPDEKSMRLAMIEGMIDVLGDPYTQYVPPEDVAEFNKQLRGTYAGIGAEVNVLDGYLTIVTPMDDSPALHAGVMAGDIVLEIEGETTFEVPVTACVEKLTGESGTAVSIRVRHLDGTEEDITITRERIVTLTVKGVRRIGETWSHCLDDELDLCYVRVTQFNEGTVDELHQVLAGEIEGGLRGLVLDLRGNPGGGLPAAVAMADLFLEEGLIVSVRPRAGAPSETTYRAKTEGTLPDFPMIVMVNGESASASEIVAGALQDNGRARILGTRTFGKGSVQEVRDLLYGGGTLKFTAAHYHLPGGRNIHRTAESTEWGVDPDPGFVLPVTPEARLEHFLARRDYEIIRVAESGAEPCVDASWVREKLKDEELAAAADALRARVTAGTWPTVTEEDASLVATLQELGQHARRRARLLDSLREVEEHLASLHARAAAAGAEPALPAGVDLSGAKITIDDANGALVGRFRVTSGNLALALDAVTLEPVAEQPPGESGGGE